MSLNSLCEQNSSKSFYKYFASFAEQKENLLKYSYAMRPRGSPFGTFMTLDKSTGVWGNAPYSHIKKIENKKGKILTTKTGYIRFAQYCSLKNKYNKAYKSVGRLFGNRAKSPTSSKSPTPTGKGLMGCRCVKFFSLPHANN
jgi:hypothetical protein